MKRAIIPILCLLFAVLCVTPANGTISLAQPACMNLDQPSENPDTFTCNGTSAGNLVVIMVWGYASNRTVTSITDNQGNSYVEDHESVAGSFGYAFYSSKIVTGGNLTFTVSFGGGNSGGHNVIVYELATTTSWVSPWFDVASGAASGTGTSHTTSSFTTSQNNVFIIVGDRLSNARNVNWSTPPNFTPDVGGNAVRHAGRSLGNTAGANTASGSWGSSTNWTIAAAAYKDAAAAAKKRVVVAQ